MFFNDFIRVLLLFPLTQFCSSSSSSSSSNSRSAAVDIGFRIQGLSVNKSLDPGISYKYCLTIHFSNSASHSLHSAKL